MYTILIIIHVIASIFLIAVILLQAGRGGGLADSFGGSQLQSLFGTKSTNVLTRLTTICATAFILTCLSLAIISSHRAKSLVEKVDIPEAMEPVKADVYGDEQELPVLPSPEETQGGAGEVE
ncbi:preprotein translocase subunit SecG [Candidatus Omnitrophota bacterium]